jgi:hypothetical protein
MAYTKEETREAQDILRDILTPGQTIYTGLRSVASNGMSRHIEVLVPGVAQDGKPYIRNITSLVARALGMRVSDMTDALVVGGTGMDMGFHVVYSIGSALYPEGVKCTGSNGYSVQPSEENGYTGKPSKAYRCNSNDHFNDHTLPYSRRQTHRDGGYTFEHSWI